MHNGGWVLPQTILHLGSDLQTALPESSLGWCWACPSLLQSAVWVGSSTACRVIVELR